MARFPRGVPPGHGHGSRSPFRRYPDSLSPGPFPASRACSAYRQASRSGGFSGGVGSSVTFRSRDRGSLPQRQRAAATLPRALLLREVEPGREQSGGWMSGRVFPPLATTDLKGDGIMQTATAPGASARTFLIHMFSRGLDDNRYVVERYKSTFDGEIVRWPCKSKSMTGKQPRQVMSLGAVQRMRPERDEIIVCTGVKITGSGIQYWGSTATGLFAERRRKGR